MEDFVQTYLSLDL